MTQYTFTPSPTPNTIRAADGRILLAPDGWILLPPDRPSQEMFGFLTTVLKK
jgi:hypothetical protein